MNTFKKTTIASAAAATAAILTTGTGVSANELVQPTTAPETPVESKGSEVVVVAPTDETSAQAQVNTLTNVVVSAQTKYDAAASTEQTLNDQVTDANQDLATETQNNKQLATDIATTTSNIDDLTDQVQTDSDAVATAQTNYDNAVAANPTAGEQIDNAQVDYDSATDAVATAQDNVATIQNDVDTLQKTVDTQDDAVVAAETKVATKTTDVNAAQTALDSAKTKYAALKSEVTAKTAELQDAVNNTGTSITETKSEVVATSNFTDLIKYFNDYSVKHEPLTLSGSETIDIELTKAQKEELARTGEFTYTPNNEEITKWVVTYVNELRRLNGISERVTASSEAIKIAVARTAEMERNNQLSHASDLPYESENIGAGMLDTTAEKGDVEKGMRPLILSDQAMAYFMVYGWFDDATSGGYGHRNSLLFDNGEIGVAVDLNETKSYGYFAYDLINLDKNKDYGYMVTTYNYDEVKDANGQLNTTINGKKPVFLPDYTFNMINTTTTVKANPPKAAAQKALDNYKTSSAKQLDASAAKVQAAKTALANAQTELTAAKAELATAKDNVDPQAEQKLQAAKSKLTDAKHELASAKVAQDKANDALTAAKQMSAPITSALNTLNAAKATLTKTDADLKVAKDRLVNLQTAKTASDNKLEDLKANLETLSLQYTNAKEAKDVAAAQLEKAKNDLKVAKAYLATFVKQTVDGGKVSADTKKPTTVPVTVHYGNKAPGQTTYSPVAPTAANSNTVGAASNDRTYAELRHDDAAVEKLTTAKLDRRIERKQQTLPTTGSENTAKATAIGAGLATIGLFGMMKRKKRG